MEITIIGIVVIVLSVIAFFKNEDWLLYLTIFFSTFTAAAVFSSGGATLTPFKVPMLLWILKQLIIFVKLRPKITINLIKNTLKENKVFTALLIFSFVIVLSNIWLLVSGINYDYYDITFLEDRTVRFSKANISQTLGILECFAFIMILSLKTIDKEKIKTILNVFLVSTVCAVFWGVVQFVLYYLNISYPAFLFNNNPGFAQCYDQVMHGIKRINSIGTEPSVFALNLLAAIPIILIPWLYKEKKGIIVSGILLITIICTLLTTSSTAIVGLFVTIGILAIYLIVKYIKESKSKAYGKKFIRLIIYMIFCGIVLAICLVGSYKLSNIKVEEASTSLTEEVKEEEQQQKINILDAIREMTVSKLSSGSGQERMAREGLGFEIYSLSPIFGVGYISFRTFTMFTNVLVNMGIIGVIALLYLIYVVLKPIILNRKKDEVYFLVFLLSIIGMLVAFMVSIPDLIYIYFWTILVLGYKYFMYKEDVVNDEKSNIKGETKKTKKIIGIDGRALDSDKRTGITTYIYETIKRLNDIDKFNIYYIYSNREVKFDFKLNSNFKIRRYNCKQGTLGYYFLLPKMLKEDNVDVMWGTQHCLPMRNKHTKNIKYILTVHDLAIHKLKSVGEFKNTIIQKLFLKRSCKSADKIIAVSKATQKDIIEIFGIKKEKINVIYEGTSFTSSYDLTDKQENEIETKYNIKNKDFIFFLSTIEPRKNLNTAIKAFEKYKDDKKSDLKFIISGGIGWKCKDTLELIEKSKYKDDILKTGYISKEEKEYFFKNCKAFLYPSLYEGFGLPILEAMQKGAIVITSNISSIPEVGGKVPLYLNNVYDVNELKGLIKKALTLSEEKRKTIVQKGYEQVKKFTWEDCANNLFKILVND